MSAIALAGCIDGIENRSTSQGESLTPTELNQPTTPAETVVETLQGGSPAEPRGRTLDVGSVEFRWSAVTSSTGNAVQSRILINGAAQSSCGYQAGNRCTVEIARPGTYQWQVQSRSTSGLEALSSTVAFTAVKERRVLLASPPSESSGLHPDIVRSAAERGVVAWDGYDGWQIRMVTRADYNAYGEFVKEWGGHRVGVAFGQQIFQIGLGDSACNGKWTPYNENTIYFIAAHEMGHILGVAHSSDPTSVMYSTMQPSYAAPCEFKSGSADVQAYGYTHWNRHVPTATNYHFAFDPGADTSMKFCILSQAGNDCTEWVYGYRQTVHLGAGDYQFQAHCGNWYYTCTIQYRIAYDT
ncbi:MAG TPA: matrixin family metalloprotease [Candidatus Thermoplasmatota archaeon]|nr:matrixin family metalloprotease [Candidatus Thermoplasmatota archaeon]